jgi:hypothetical protein
LFDPDFIVVLLNSGSTNFHLLLFNNYLFVIQFNCDWTDYDSNIQELPKVLHRQNLESLRFPNHPLSDIASRIDRAVTTVPNTSLQYDNIDSHSYNICALASQLNSTLKPWWLILFAYMNTIQFLKFTFPTKNHNEKFILKNSKLILWFFL